MDLGDRPSSDGCLNGGHILDIQDTEDVLEKLMKLFEIPKIIHIFARFLTESALFYRKSLKASTINNV